VSDDGLRASHQPASSAADVSSLHGNTQSTRHDAILHGSCPTTRSVCRDTNTLRQPTRTHCKLSSCFKSLLCRCRNSQSKLMLMRRTTAVAKFHTQVVLVCIQYISAKIYSSCASQPEIPKNSLKPLFLGFKVVQGRRFWFPRKARQQCLL